jgi:ATP synthase protein I
MSESGPPEDPLRRLGQQIDEAARARESSGSRGSAARNRDITSSGTALGFGLRVGVELIAALLVGLALGWLANKWIRPWGLIAGFFLGSAAGILNVFRAVQGMGGSGSPPPAGGRRG